MSKNVYFHIDELGRDAITASALKKACGERGVNLVYGNRVYTKRVLQHFAFAFDIIILPRPMFLNDFKNIAREIPPIVILLTESVGRVVDQNNDKFTLFSILDKPFMEGDTRYVDKVSMFLLWGDSGKRRIDKYYPSISEKFHVVGHPRHDARCFSHKKINSSKEKSKIGLITRQPLLNDFLKRRPVEAIVSSSSSLDVRYDYNNKCSGDFLLSQDNNAADELYMEAVDIQILLQLLLKLNNEGHEIHLKVHPREDRELWVGFVKKYDLNVVLAHWCIPFSHWVEGLDYVIGPSSTSFYDCCIAGVEPICTRKIIKNRDIHINKFSEEYGALMEHIVTPDSIEEIISIVRTRSQNFSLSDEIKQILALETDYPESINSIDKLLDHCLELKETNKVGRKTKYLNLIGFKVYGSFFNYVMKFHRIIKNRTEQGSTFLLTKKNRAYIDSLVD